MTSEQMLYVLLVLAIGLGLGSAASAWVTRKPEFVARLQGRTFVIESDPTPEQISEFQARWERLTSTAPGMALGEPVELLPRE